MKFVLGLIFGISITFAGVFLQARLQPAAPVTTSAAKTTVPDTARPPMQEAAIQSDPPNSPSAAPVLSTEPLTSLRLPDEEEPSTGGTEVVWTQFHSQASANGFANYLSAAVNHPFVVSREGPARYQVSYQYANADQAEDLAAKIKLITGEK